MADFQQPLVFRQPGSRRPIYNWKPPKESLRHIGVVPDFDASTCSDRRHLCPAMIAPYRRADRSILIVPAAYSKPLTWMPDNCTGTLAPSDSVPGEDGLRAGTDFPAARGLQRHMTLHDQTVLRNSPLQHQCSHIIDTRQLPIDCVDEDQSTMVSDDLRFQRVCRPDSLIRVQCPLRMELPDTIESIIRPPAQCDLLQRVVVPLIKPHSRRRILVQMHVFRKRRIRTLAWWRRDDRDGPPIQYSVQRSCAYNIWSYD